MSGKLDHAGCKNTDRHKFKLYMPWSTDQLGGLICQECMSEWLLPKFQDDDDIGKESLKISGQKYKLLQKQGLADSQFRIQKHHTTFTDLGAAEECLKVADHICYKTYGGAIIHHAIIVAKVKSDENTIRFTLIHWQRLHGKEYEIIEEGDVNLREKAKSVTRCDYPKDYVKADPPELVTARAIAWKGDKNYSLFNNNCEHFATYCKVGCPNSFQQQKIKTKVAHILLELSGLGVRVATGLSKKVVASSVADVAGDFIEYGAAYGGARFLTVSTQSIGFGVVVAINGVLFTFDVGKACNQYRKAKLTRSEFKNRIWRQFITLLERSFFTGIIPAACAVVFGIVVSNPTTLAACGVLAVGAIVGGALATAVEGFGQTQLGRALSFILRPSLDHSDKTVKSIDQLKKGDHVVVSKWFLHPRCHVIIVDIMEKEQNMIVIRFKHENGVVEERLPFKKPVYKVLYDDWQCFPPDVVIERARKKKGQQELVYNIARNNCKSFARWCKTGISPKGPFAIKGYYDETKEINNNQRRDEDDSKEEDDDDKENNHSDDDDDYLDNESDENEDKPDSLYDDYVIIDGNEENMYDDDDDDRDHHS